MCLGPVAGPRPRHVEDVNRTTGDEVAEHIRRPGSRKPRHIKQQTGLIEACAILCRQPGPSLEPAEVQYDGRVAVLYILLGTSGMNRRSVLAQGIVAGDGSILGQAPARAPSTRGNTQIERRVECSAVDPGLAT